VKRINRAEKPAIYADLIRFRLSIAVTLSAVTGYFIFDSKSDFSLVFLISGIFLLATGASALNQVVERDQDSLMQRTRNRPLPLKEISLQKALLFSLCHLASGIALLLFAGTITALLGILNIILYILVYTRLKRITSLAVIPGAAVGAIPPVIGYTAAGGTSLTTELLLFSGFLFLWQLPHFWLIIMKYREDYQKAGFKTFSQQMTEKDIRNLIFLWVLFSTAFLVIFLLFGLIFNNYLTAILIPLNLLFIFLFHRFLYQRTGPKATQGALVLVNSFGLLVMLIFIINALLR